jgi:hypothetical protein
MPSRLARRLLAVVLFTATFDARAAHVTDVADAMDELHPLEIDLEPTFSHVREETRITREQAAGGAINLVDELHLLRTIDELSLRLAVGLWHDLELHVIAPLVLHDQQDWRYADVNGVSVENASTLKNNHVDISGCLRPGACAASAPPSPIVPVPGQSNRAGFRDPTIGIAWGPINEERELRLHPEKYPTGKPVSTWVIGLDYTLPLPVDVDDPSRFGFHSQLGGATPLPSSGPEAKRVHAFTLWTAFSKRFRVLDPYVRIWARAPIVPKSGLKNDGPYDNCWHPELLADVAQQNCASGGPWSGQTGYQPPYQAGFTMGTELVAAEDHRAQQKLAFDIRADVRYVGPGRDYTQVADMLGKLTYAEEYLNAVGQIGLYGRVARWLHARIYGSLGFDTPHFLTGEQVGEDKTGAGKITISAGSGRPAIDQNPTYDFRLDQLGRRLRAESVLIWGLAGTVSLNF